MADALRGLRGTATLSLSRSSRRRIRVDPGAQVDRLIRTITGFEAQWNGKPG